MVKIVFWRFQPDSLCFFIYNCDQGWGSDSGRDFLPVLGPEQSWKGFTWLTPWPGAGPALPSFPPLGVRGAGYQAGVVDSVSGPRRPAGSLSCLLALRSFTHRPTPHFPVKGG